MDSHFDIFTLPFFNPISKKIQASLERNKRIKSAGRILKVKVINKKGSAFIFIVTWLSLDLIFQLQLLWDVIP